jgi:FixJ family two-component response regulator
MPQAIAKIILVDSDASVRRAIGRLLASSGFACETFASAEELLSAEGGPDGACVLADSRLPGIGGIELMRRVAAGSPGLPFILLSLEEDEAMRRKAREAGAAAFFRKPVDAEALLDAIRWVLHSPSSATAA